MSATCIHPWADAWINAKGLVTCCPQNSTVLGDLNSDRFSTIWNSAKACEVRELISRAQYRRSGCDRQCPFLRGSFDPPESLPPIAELINPVFSQISDGTPYAKNHRTVMEDFRTRRSKVSGLPLFVDIQPLLACNSRCIMCRQPHLSRLRHSSHVIRELETLKPHANYFRWQGGEVFLNKDFPRYLEEFDSDLFPHLRRYVITNGTLIDEAQLDILSTGPRPVHFLISIDGATEHTYRKVRGNSLFKKAIGSLNFLAARQKRYRRRDIVRWNYVVMRSTLGEMSLAMDMADELGVNLNFAPIQGDYPEENPFLFRTDSTKELELYFNEMECHAQDKRIEISGFKGILARLSKN